MNLVTLCRYGTILPSKDLDWPPECVADDLSVRLDEVIKSNLLALPKPIGLAFSGGIDSSLLAARTSGLDVSSYTLSCGRAPGDANQAACELGLRWTLLPGGEDLDLDLDAVVRAIRVPTHSAAPFGFLKLYRELECQGLQSVITGDGADELFGGHYYHQAPHPCWGSDAPLWECYRAVRRLEAELDVVDLFSDEYLAEYDSEANRWERSDFAQRVQAQALEMSDLAQRLRFVDVALRMIPQCVAMQQRLADFCGLRYDAPYSDLRLVRTALATPLGSSCKGPLRELLLPHGQRWLDLPKDPMYTPTGGRDPKQIPIDWWDAWSESSIRKHGIFSGSHVKRLIRGLDSRDAFLPRGLVVVATAHRLLDLLAEH